MLQVTIFGEGATERGAVETRETPILVNSEINVNTLEDLQLIFYGVSFQ